MALNLSGLRKPTQHTAIGIAIVAAAALLAGCSTASTTSASTTADNGTSLTLWARHIDGDLPKLLAEQYNKTHKNQIKVTIIPGDAYQQKIGAAAGAGQLPDLLSSDVVYSPNYVKQGLFQDITSQMKGLPFYDKLSHAQTDAASKDGKIYAAPLSMDSSLVIYNKDLFKKAGLDPSVGPANFDEIYKDAKAVRALGGDTYGFYFGGNCAGCNAYTMFGYLAAAGTPPLKNDGTKVDLNSPAMNDTLALYKKMWDQDIIPQGAKSEDGSNWPTLFNAGKIGILPIGTFNFAALKTAPFDWGVASLPAPKGGAASTFVGGDVIGISKTSKHAAQAFDFIKWELGNDAQVNVVAKTGNLPARGDLSDNKYSAADPRLVLTNKGLATGYTPSSVAYGDIFNNGNGPWMKLIRDYIFTGQIDAAKTAQKSAQDALDSAK